MTFSGKTEAVFCIGSNCGDRVARVASGMKWLSLLLEDFRSSVIYATPDCHGGQREYMNAVVAGLTHIHPAELDQLCKEYELRSGRDSLARTLGEVPVDIDLVIYGDSIMREKDYRCEFFLKGFREIQHHRNEITST